MKKILALLSILVLAQPAFADFKEHFDLGQQYLSNYQYSGAITEFKNALRINYLDNSARIGLVNSYLARGTYNANTEKDYKKAADDYRSALFYLVYYPNANQVKNSSQAIIQVTSNLNKCLSVMNFNTNPENRFNTAKQLRAEGEFAAAGYEFNQALGDTAYIKDSFRQTGDIMKLLGNDPKATEYYKKAVNVAPTDIDLRLAYAGMLDKSGNDKDAVEEYNYVLSKTTDDKDILYTLERIYKKKLETSPNDANLTANLGAIMQKEGKFDDALQYYRKAEYLDPSNITTRVNVGTLYQQKGDYKTAIIAYDSILTLYPDNLQANMYKAQSLAAMGDKKNALELYKKVSAMDPTNADIKNQMMDIVRTTMTPAQFVDYVKKNSLNPADTLYNYALDLHKQNKLDDAIALYNETLKLNTTNPEIYVNLALAQSQKGDTDSALATLSTAGAKFPTNTQIKDTEKSIKTQLTNQKLDAAAAFYNGGKYQDAINAYLTIDPPTADTMLSVASSYQNLKDNANALVYYIKAFNLRPTDSEIAYYIASIYAQQEKWTDAKTYTNKALALNKDNPDAKGLSDVIAQQENSAALEKAIGLFDAQKYDDSFTLLNQVLKADTKNPYAYYYRGMVYDAKTKYVEAIADYKQAIGFDPTLAIVNYLIAIDYDNLNQPQNALPYYKKFVATYTEQDDYKTYANERIQSIK